MPLSLLKLPKKFRIVACAPGGRTRGRDRGRMNALEIAYAQRLDLMKHTAVVGSGEVVDWWFEGIKLKLAGNTFYEPDFLVQLANGELEIHEVKGHWEDDARVKIKVAAEKFPFRFIAVMPTDRKRRAIDGDWKFEVFSQPGDSR